MIRTIAFDPDRFLCTSALRRATALLEGCSLLRYDAERPVRANELLVGEVTGVPDTGSAVRVVNGLERVVAEGSGFAVVDEPFTEGLCLGVAGNRYAPPYIVGGVDNPLTGAANRPVQGGSTAQGLYSLGPIGYPNHCLPGCAGPEVRVLGVVVGEDSRPLSMADFRETVTAEATGRPCPLILIAGHGSNAGKTTVAQAVFTELRERRCRPCYFKMTGTASCRDLARVSTPGMGARNGSETYPLWDSNTPVRDFVDGVGTVSDVTGDTENFVKRTSAYAAVLPGHLECDVLVVELADGLCHRSNLKLLAGAFFRSNLSCLVYVPHPSAEAALHFQAFWQQGLGYGGLPVILSGPLANDPELAMVREELSARSNVLIRPSARPEGGQWVSFGRELVETILEEVDITGNGVVSGRGG